jgi:hypothetical protein
MKIFKWIGIIAFLLIVFVGMGLFLFLKTLDINRYKDKLAQEMGSLIGRDVTIDSLGLDISFAQGVALHVKGLRFQDDPQFSNQLFLQADHVQLDMNVLAFLLQRKILASQIQIHSPMIRIVRNKEGLLNIPAGVPVVQADQTDHSSPVVEGLSHRREPLPPTYDAIKQFQLSIETIHLDNGKIIFLDHEQSSPMELSMEHLNVRVQGFSLQDAFSFELDGAVFSRDANFHLKGQARMDPSLGQARLDDVTMTMELDKMAVWEVQQAFFSDQGVELGKAWKGTLTIEMSQMVISPEGLLLLALEGGLEGGEIIFSQLSVPLEDIQMKYEMSEHDVRLSQFTVDLGGGRLSLVGNVDDYPKRQKFSGHFQLENISLEELTKTMKAPIRLGGWIQAEGDFSGKGFGKRFIPSLEGEGTLTLTKGRLQGVNLLQMIFASGGDWTALMPNLQENLPDSIKENISREDTLFKNIGVRWTAGNAFIGISEFLMETEEVAMKAHGQIDWNFHSELESTGIIAPELSKKMLEEMEVFEPLLDEERRITIPMEKYEGPLGSFRPTPDGKYMAQKMMDILGRQKLLELVDKALGREAQGNEVQEGKARDGRSPKGKMKEEPLQGRLEKLLYPKGPASQGESSQNDSQSETSTKEEDFINNLFETMTIKEEL